VIEFDADPADLPSVDDSTVGVTLDCLCGECGRHFPGADKRGGHCSTCHLSFASQTGFDRHRTGKYENRAIDQPNTRRCLTPAELEGKGWSIDAHGLVRMPAPATNPWKSA
jgi:hypothetical protein